MELGKVIEKYRALTAGKFGQPAALAAFGLRREETEQVFSVLDEDYHISRYFHFENRGGTAFRINGFEHTHVSIDAEIQEIL